MLCVLYDNSYRRVSNIFLLEELAIKFIETYPKSSISYLIYADMLINRAGMLKDRHQLNVNKKEDYDGLISKAKKTLQNDIKAFVQDPHWYELMLIVSSEEKWSKEEYTQFSNQAIKQFPNYLPIYFAAIGYLLPHTYYHELEFELNHPYTLEGKENHEEEINQLALRAVEETKTKYNKGMYARIHWYVLSRSSLNKPLFKKSTVNWKLMKDSFEDVIDQYPVQWNINNFARFACLAGDPVTTHKLINQIKGEPYMLAWHEKSFFERCETWATLITNEIK